MVRVMDKNYCVEKSLRFSKFGQRVIFIINWHLSFEIVQLRPFFLKCCDALTVKEVSYMFCPFDRLLVSVPK